MQTPLHLNSQASLWIAALGLSGWQEARSHWEAFPQKSVYTQTLLHKSTFTPRSFCTKEHKSVYAQKRLHRKPFHREALTQKSVCTKKVAHKFRPKKLFTHRSSFAEDRWHRVSFYTEHNLHADAFTQRFLYAQTRLHKEAFIHKEAFTQQSVYTQDLLHRREFTQIRLSTA